MFRWKAHDVLEANGRKLATNKLVVLAPPTQSEAEMVPDEYYVCLPSDIDPIALLENYMGFSEVQTMQITSEPMDRILLSNEVIDQMVPEGSDMVHGILTDELRKKPGNEAVLIEEYVNGGGYLLVPSARSGESFSSELRDRMGLRVLSDVQMITIPSNIMIEVMGREITPHGEASLGLSL